MIKLLWDRDKLKPHAGPPSDMRAGGSENTDSTNGGPDQAAKVRLTPAVGVLGAKGGVGASTCALNLAFALSRHYSSTVLIDADLQSPDISTLLGLDPHYTLLDLLLKAPQTDRSIFEACTVEVRESERPVNLLVPPAGGEAGVRSNLTQLAECFDVVRPYSSAWVVDLPGHLDRHLVNLMDRLSTILLVLEATLTGVGAARRWLKFLADLGYGRDRVILVVNRSGARIRGVEEEIDSCFSGYSIFKLPNAFQMAEECALHGVPAVVRHPKESYARAVYRLAAWLNLSLEGQAANEGIEHD